MDKIQLSETELRVLRSIHLRGCTGPMGGMTLLQRRALIQGLVTKGLINNRAQLTPLGITVSAPSYSQTL